MSADDGRLIRCTTDEHLSYEIPRPLLGVVTPMLHVHLSLPSERFVGPETLNHV